MMSPVTNKLAVDKTGKEKILLILMAGGGGRQGTWRCWAVKWPRTTSTAI